MSVLRNPWWLLAVVAFLLHQLAQRVFELAGGPLDSYLDPFLATPILLGLWLLERRLIFRQRRLTALEVGVATLILAVIFEEVFPTLKEGFRQDVVDYAFYALGGVYFYFLINQKK
jgi:hypothetical protein